MFRHGVTPPPSGSTTISAATTAATANPSHVSTHVQFATSTPPVLMSSLGTSLSLVRGKASNALTSRSSILHGHNHSGVATLVDPPILAPLDPIAPLGHAHAHSHTKPTNPTPIPEVGVAIQPTLAPLAASAATHGQSTPRRPASASLYSRAASAPIQQSEASIPSTPIRRPLSGNSGAFEHARLLQGRITEDKLREMCGTQDLATVKYFEIRISSDNQVLADIAKFLPNLEQLRIDDSRLHNFRDFGRGLRKLRVLSVCRCTLKDLNGISEALPQLEELYAAGNEISDLSPLAYHTALRVLQLQGNRITDIDMLDWLAECPNLTRLVLLGNPLVSLKYYRRIVVSRVTPSGTLASLDGVPLQAEDREPITDPAMETIRIPMADAAAATATTSASAASATGANRSRAYTSDDVTSSHVVRTDPTSRSPTHSLASCTPGQTQDGTVMAGAATTIAVDTETAVSMQAAPEETNSLTAPTTSVGVGMGVGVSGTASHDVFGWNVGTSIFGGLSRPATSSSSVSGASRGKPAEDIAQSRDREGLLASSTPQGPSPLPSVSAGSPTHATQSPTHLQSTSSTTFTSTSGDMSQRRPASATPASRAFGLPTMAGVEVSSETKLADNLLSEPVVGAIATVKRIRTKRQSMVGSTVPLAAPTNPVLSPRESSASVAVKSETTPAPSVSKNTSVPAATNSTPSYYSSLALDDWSELSAAVAHGIEPSGFVQVTPRPITDQTPRSDHDRCKPGMNATSSALAVQPSSRPDALHSPMRPQSRDLVSQPSRPASGLVASPRPPSNLVSVPVPPKHIRKSGHGSGSARSTSSSNATRRD